jgi:hypothetical protein
MTPKQAPTDPMAPLVDAIASRVIDYMRPLLESSTLALRPRLLTVEQAAVYLARTPNAVRCLLTKDAFPAVKADGRTMLDVRDLDRWIDQNKVNLGVRA